jgi:S-adenosylmethionine hydrolase
MWCSATHAAALVFQTDFGLKDGAVVSMKAVAFSVDPALPMFDITHEIPAYNIWEAALRLDQSAAYWPAGTVFVSVVDPGVGSERRSVVLKTRSGQYFVSPDNGSLMFVAESLGVEQVREIDESTNRLPGSDKSFTFHGRDVYAYTAARLAAGVIKFEEVGPDRGQELVRIPYQEPVLENGTLLGGIPVLDSQFGNIWTNIDWALFETLGMNPGDGASISIFQGENLVVELDLPYVNSFAGVEPGQPLIYMNDLGQVAVALNQDSFAERFGVTSGAEWKIRIKSKGPVPAEP